jgi:GT2 family glycosyltransferase
MMAADALDEDEIVSSISGAAFAVSKRLFDLLGGFDGSFFLYVEDNDLSWRAQLAGYDCQCVPRSVVYHEYRPQFGPSKYFYLERNRYLMLLKSFRGRTLAVLMPALALSELVTWGYALLQGRGYVAAKLRVYKWLAQHSAEVRRARAQVQERRLVPDRRLLERCSYQLGYQLASDGFAATVAQAVFDPLFRVVHRACLATIRW